MKKPSVALRNAVDRYGEIKAKQGDLKEQEEKVRKLILKSRLKEIDGFKYRAAVSLCDGKLGFDVELAVNRISKRFKITKDEAKSFILGCYVAGADYKVIRVSARKK